MLESQAEVSVSSGDGDKNTTFEKEEGDGDRTVDRRDFLSRMMHTVTGAVLGICSIGLTHAVIRRSEDDEINRYMQEIGIIKLRLGSTKHTDPKDRDFTWRHSLHHDVTIVLCNLYKDCLSTKPSSKRETVLSEIRELAIEAGKQMISDEKSALLSAKILAQLLKNINAEEQAADLLKAYYIAREEILNNDLKNAGLLSIENRNINKIEDIQLRSSILAGIDDLRWTRLEIDDIHKRYSLESKNIVAKK